MTFKKVNLRVLFVICCMLLICSVLLSACGFQLRGSGMVATESRAILIRSDKLNAQLLQALKKLAAMHSIVIVNKIDTADAILQLHSDSFKQQAMAIDIMAKVQEYQLSYRQEFSVWNSQKKELLGRQGVTAQQTLRYDENALLAKSAEKENLQRLMVKDVARQLLWRIQALKIAQSQHPE